MKRFFLLFQDMSPPNEISTDCNEINSESSYYLLYKHLQDFEFYKVIRTGIRGAWSHDISSHQRVFRIAVQNTSYISFI